jgi:sugar phosphate isomerase/epimerase
MKPPELLAAAWTTAGDAAPLRGDEVSPFALRDRVAAAAAAGWKGFGIGHADLAAAGSEDAWSALRDVIDDHRISHVELEFLADWWTDGERRAQSDAVRSDLLRAAELIRPRHVKVGANFDGAAVDPDRFANEFDRLCRQAADVGTRIALEPMPFTNLPTVRSGAEFVRSVGNPAGGLCVDIWHIYRAGDDPADLPSYLTPEIVFAVELDDADDDVVGTLFEDTINNRRLCGRGVWDIPKFIRALWSVGFDGPWGVEIISHEHRARPLDEAVRMAYETTVEAFAAADVGG